MCAENQQVQTQLPLAPAFRAGGAAAEAGASAERAPATASPLSTSSAARRAARGGPRGGLLNIRLPALRGALAGLRRGPATLGSPWAAGLGDEGVRALRGFLTLRCRLRLRLDGCFWDSW